jgi:hypothetical protein
MPVSINVEIDADKKQIALSKFSAELPHYLQGARIEITDLILDTKGLRNYPPSTAANQPPTPFYIRGRGTQTSAGRNTLSSERLGTRWQSVPYSKIGMKISNPVSYASYVHGEQQARHMARIGWRKLYETAKGKTKQIATIYNRWIARLIKKHDL